MKQSLVNVGLIKNSVKRFWPLWLAFAAAWLVCLVLPIALIAPQYGAEAIDAFGEGWIVENVGSVFGIALASILSAVLVFEYLFNQSAAMFHGALPIKRGTLFASIYLAGLLPLLVIELAVGLILIALSCAYPCVVLDKCTSWLVFSLGTTFILYSMAVLCSQLSGSRSLAAVLFIMGNCLIIGFESVIRILGWSMLWGLNIDFDILTVWTSPIGGLLKYVLCLPDGMAFEDTSSLIAFGAYCLAAVAFMAVAAILNKYRSFERAGSTVAFTGLQITFKYVVGAALAMVFGFVALFCTAISYGDQGLTLAQQIAVAVMMALGGFVGIFFGEAYSQKSARVFGKVWKSGLVLAVLSIAFVAGCSLDVLGIQSFTPKASDVKSVVVSYNGNETAFADKENIEKVINAHQMILDNGKDPDTDNDLTFGVSIEYALSSGRVVSRSYDVTLSDHYYNTDGNETGIESPEGRQIQKAFSDVLNSEEGLSNRYSEFLGDNSRYVSVSIDMSNSDENDVYQEKFAELTPEQVEEFLNGPFKKDLLENGAGNLGVDADSSVDYKGNFTMYGNVASSSGYRYLNETISLSTKHTPNCLKWIAQNVLFSDDVVEG